MKLSLCIICAIAFIAGCQSSHRAQREEPAPPRPRKAHAPEIIINVGSLNLARYAKKIEEAEVDTFANTLKRDTLDIILLEGITRYPQLPDRIDIVDVLASRTGLRSAFGETVSVNGRQNGNALFSDYPIKSSENTHYDNLHSTRLEAALQGIVDCGVREVVAVSTLLPEHASVDDQSTVAGVLGSFNNLYENDPIIISGNLPTSDAIRSIASYNDARPIPANSGPRMWFSKDGSLKLLGVNVENTNLGPMTVEHFGIFRQVGP